METLDIKQKFIELRAKGNSYDKIAKELGKSKQTLIDWSKELEEEIANTKALELEAMYEKYYLLKELRLETFGKVLSKIRTEIEKRSLSDVPTDKLLDLYLKYDTKASEELIDPNFKSTSEKQEDQLDRKLLEELTRLEGRKLKRV